MMDTDDLIDTLNDLIETSKDVEEGFRHSAESIEDQRLKAYLLQRSAEVDARVKELQELVISLGGSPVDSTSISGALHSKWIDFKTALALNDNVTTLDEIEHGEHVALSAYDEALALNLPPEVEVVIFDHYEEAKRHFESIGLLNEALESRGSQLTTVQRLTSMNPAFTDFILFAILLDLNCQSGFCNKIINDE